MPDFSQVNPDCPGCQALLKIIAEMQKTIDRLEARLEKVEREQKRQAAPFRKPPKTKRKKPGRKKGPDHGDHHRRVAPEKIDETYDVPLPDCCPDCGHDELSQIGTLVQYQTEIPRTVIHRQFNIESGCCDGCGAAVQGRHELQTSDAVGAAGVQLGANVHATMAIANKELGLSHGKVKRLLEMLFGLKVGRSTSCRSVIRSAQRLEQAAEQIRKEVRGSPQVVADETGWRVDGRSAWLHVFAGLNATCYEIDPTRSVAPAERILGLDWDGVFGHDGWSVYNQFKNATHQQCLAHLLRRCDQLIEKSVGGQVHFPRKVKALLKRALHDRDRHRIGKLTDHGVRRLGTKHLLELYDLVRPPKSNPANQRFRNFLGRHLLSIFNFLQQPWIDATNWRGEQAIRPAVVNRKVWGGNRTWNGARAQQILMSVIQTAKQRLADPFQLIRDQLQTTAPMPLPRVM